MAGGRSSRMGKNKALLAFKGLPMVEHMQKILANAGLVDIYISGTLEGYETIPDHEPQAGPGRAIAHLISEFANRYERLFFIPVDMPSMSENTVRRLILTPGNVFIKSHPLPCSLLTRDAMLAASSVKGILTETSATALDIADSEEKDFLNLNTPEEWEKAMASTF